MSKLPYFKFVTSKWNLGEIQFRTLEEQGLFINVISLLWERGEISEKYIKNKYGVIRSNTSVSEILRALYESDLLVLKDGFIEANFLDDMKKESQIVCDKNRENIQKRWQKAKELHTVEYHREEKRREEKRIEEKENKIKKNKQVCLKKAIFFRTFDHLAISVEENQKLLELGYSQEQVSKTYDRIQNYKLNKNYKSLYLTAMNWLEKDATKIKSLPQIQPKELDWEKEINNE